MTDPRSHGAAPSDPVPTGQVIGRAELAERRARRAEAAVGQLESELARLRERVAHAPTEPGGPAGAGAGARRLATLRHELALARRPPAARIGRALVAPRPSAAPVPAWLDAERRLTLVRAGGRPREGTSLDERILDALAREARMAGRARIAAEAELAAARERADALAATLAAQADARDLLRRRMAELTEQTAELTARIAELEYDRTRVAAEHEQLLGEVMQTAGEALAEAERRVVDARAAVEVASHDLDDAEQPPAPVADGSTTVAEPAVEDAPPAAGEPVPGEDAGAGPTTSRAPRGPSAPPSMWLRTALPRLAASDPGAGTALLLGVLSAQALSTPYSLDYDLLLADQRPVAVTVHGRDVQIHTLEKRRRRRDVDFRVQASAPALARLVTGERLSRRERWRIKVRGARRRRVLSLLGPLTLDLGVLLDAGIVPPARALTMALATLVDPAWTRGHSFSIGIEIDRTIRAGTSLPVAAALAGGQRPTIREAWAIVVADGAPLRVVDAPTGVDPRAQLSGSIRCSPAAFARLIDGRPARAGDRPALRGQPAQLEALDTLLARARGGAGD